MFHYSIDLSTNWYQNNDLKSGFIVENYPELKTKWKLFTGGLALNFIEQIGGGIDFCLIDTAHINPGEILDFLMVLPFLKDDAIVVFHDTNLSVCRYPYQMPGNPAWPEEWSTYPITNNLLMCSIHGNKIICNDFAKRPSDSVVLFANIAGVQINQDTKKHPFEVFNLCNRSRSTRLNPT